MAFKPPFKKGAIKMLHTLDCLWEQKKDMREYWLNQMHQDKRLAIWKKQNPSTNSLDQRQPLTTKQFVSSAINGEECYREKLREVRTINAWMSLREAIELSRNDKLRVKFSTTINATDARAIDIEYHKNC